MKIRSTFLRLLAAFAFLPPFAAHEARTAESVIYASPGGNDAWSGTLAEPNPGNTDGPVATLEKARDLVRTAKSQRSEKAAKIRVELRGGAYSMPRPLVLDSRDSGTQQAPITWSAYKNEQPTISGGVRIAHWSKTTVNGREAWVARIPGSGKVPAFHELWIDGTRLTPARWPKQGTLEVAGLSDKEKHDDWTHGSNEFRFAKDALKAWPTATDGETIVANRWVESRLPIASIDEKEHVIHCTKRSVFVLEAGDRFWVENVRECLTEPGEFYIDPREGRLPDCTRGDRPNRVQVIAPRLSQVLRLEGDPAGGKFDEHMKLPRHRVLPYGVVLRPPNDRPTGCREVGRQ